jgi:hypothetical protein
MPSPFPGMDPYLEDPAIWPSLHQSLITYTRDALQSDIRPRYNATIGERVYVVPVQRDLVREPYVEIIDLTQGGQVVTVIEVVSPSNKVKGVGCEQYQRKQREVWFSHTHLVEIDLLRSGMPTVMANWEVLYETQRWTYIASVHRATAQEQVEVDLMQLRERLPRIAIPLTAPDLDAVLDLQAVFERCYENGAYTDRINYTRPPKPPLPADDAAWAEALLRENS